MTEKLIRAEDDAGSPAETNERRPVSRKTETGLGLSALSEVMGDASNGASGVEDSKTSKTRSVRPIKFAGGGSGAEFVEKHSTTSETLLPGGETAASRVSAFEGSDFQRIVESSVELPARVSGSKSTQTTIRARSRDGRPMSYSREKTTTDTETGEVVRTTRKPITGERLEAKAKEMVAEAYDIKYPEVPVIREENGVPVGTSFNAREGKGTINETKHVRYDENGHELAA